MNMIREPLCIGVGISPSPALNSGAPPSIIGGSGSGGGGPTNTHNVIAVGATVATVIAVNSVGNLIQVGA
jgi:hypothetical protein